MKKKFNKLFFFQVCWTLGSRETAAAVDVTAMLPPAAAAGKPPRGHHHLPFPPPTNIAITAVIIINLSAPRRRTARGRAIVVMSATTLKTPPPWWRHNYHHANCSKQLLPFVVHTSLRCRDGHQQPPFYPNLQPPPIKPAPIIVILTKLLIHQHEDQKDHQGV